MMKLRVATIEDFTSLTATAATADAQHKVALFMRLYLAAGGGGVFRGSHTFTIPSHIWGAVVDRLGFRGYHDAAYHYARLAMSALTAGLTPETVERDGFAADAAYIRSIG